MSVITEVKLKIKLKKNIPVNLRCWIESTITNNLGIKFNEHPFFLTNRWDSIFSTYGYDGYERASLTKKDNYYLLSIHADINYENEEINTFLDFIKEFCFGRKKKVYIGYSINDNHAEKQNVYIIRDFKAIEL